MLQYCRKRSGLIATVLICFYGINSVNEDFHIILPVITRTPCSPVFSEKDVVEILTTSEIIPDFGNIELQKILQFDLYRYTYPLHTRSLHDLPALQQLRPSCAWKLTMQPFFNITQKMFFTRKCSGLNAYIDLLHNDDFLELIDQKDFGTLNIPNVLSIFQNITLQERRTGIMFTIARKIKNFELYSTLPIYYHEHNFFLSSREQDKLQRETLFSGFSTILPGLDLNNFVRQHLINDRAGVGNLKILLLYNIFSQSSLLSEKSLQCGIHFTFPTAHAFRQGINGGSFCKKENVPLIDFQTMFNLYNCAVNDNNKTSNLELNELIVHYGIKTIDQLTKNVADTPLGSKHIEYGPAISVASPLNDAIELQIKSIVKFSIPKTESRFLKQIKNPEDFNRDYTLESAAHDNLMFLRQQATNTLFPSHICIRVQPGIIMMVSTLLKLSYDGLEGSIGYNIWSITKESLQIRTSSLNIPYNIAAGTQHSAHEGKLFASFSTNLPSDCSNAHIGITGDYTLHSKGIGKSLTIGVNFIVDF